MNVVSDMKATGTLQRTEFDPDHVGGVFDRSGQRSQGQVQCQSWEKKHEEMHDDGKLPRWDGYSGTM